MVRTLLGGVLVVAVLVATFLSPPAAQALPTKRAWLADVRAAMDGAAAYLDARVGAGGGQLAINLDIDNTSLATRYATGDPVRPVLRFATQADNRGVRLLFNTGRLRGDGRLARVARDLAAAGYPVTEVCGRRPGKSLAQGKKQCRRRFVAEGYTLIANVGNRSTDFVGGNYERAFRLPDYHHQLG